jgi:hypothetical protein
MKNTAHALVEFGEAKPLKFMETEVLGVPQAKRKAAAEYHPLRRPWAHCCPISF